MDNLSPAGSVVYVTTRPNEDVITCKLQGRPGSAEVPKRVVALALMGSSLSMGPWASWA